MTDTYNHNNNTRGHDALRAEIHDLNRATDALITENDILINASTGNKQLRDDYDDLKADNYESIVENSNLRSENNQLRADNDESIAENSKLRVDYAEMRDDKDELRDDYDESIVENAKLRADYDELISENAQLHDENGVLLRWMEKVERTNKVDFDITLVYVGLVTAIVWGNVGCWVMYRDSR